MTEQQQHFPIRLSPGETLDVHAPDITTALDAARVAYLSLLRAGRGDAEPLVWDLGGSGYVLKCLYCALQNPERPERSLLVAMQEHQAEEHGLAFEVLNSSISVAREVPDRPGVTVYIWTLSEEVKDRLALPQRCYVQATRYSPQALEWQGVIDRASVLSLVYAQPFVGSAGQVGVVLERQDDLAWYGHPINGGRGPAPLVWPKGEWRLADGEG